MRFRVHGLTGVVVASGFLLSPAVAAQDGVSRARAVEIARDAAREADIDIENYRLWQRESVDNDRERVWLVGFVRSNAPWRPGSEFVVAIDRITGEAEVLLGE